jgi:hypothetical protein
MRPISIMWTTDVHDLEAHIAVVTVHEVLSTIYGPAYNKELNLFTPQVRPFGPWVIPALPEGTPYRSTEWYVERSQGPEAGQVSGPQFLQLILREPWQQSDPHYDLAIVEQVLAPLAEEQFPREYRGTTPLGMTIPGRAAVISVSPLRSIVDLRSRLLALRRLVAHYMGHVFGLPACPACRPEAPLPPQSRRLPSLEDSEARLSSVAPEQVTHSGNVCAMRYAPTVDALLALAKEELQNRVLFCPRCQKELLGLLIGTYFGLN